MIYRLVIQCQDVCCDILYSHTNQTNRKMNNANVREVHFVTHKLFYVFCMLNPKTICVHPCNSDEKSDDFLAQN